MHRVFGGEFVLAVRPDDQHAVPAQEARGMAKKEHSQRVRPVQVVENEHERRAARDRPEQLDNRVELARAFLARRELARRG